MREGVGRARPPAQQPIRDRHAPSTTGRIHSRRARSTTPTYDDDGDSDSLLFTVQYILNVHVGVQRSSVWSDAFGEYTIYVYICIIYIYTHACIAPADYSTHLKKENIVNISLHSIFILYIIYVHCDRVASMATGACALSLLPLGGRIEQSSTTLPIVVD